MSKKERAQQRDGKLDSCIKRGLLILDEKEKRQVAAILIRAITRSEGKK